MASNGHLEPFGAIWSHLEYLLERFCVRNQRLLPFTHSTLFSTPSTAIWLLFFKWPQMASNGLKWPQNWHWMASNGHLEPFGAFGAFGAIQHSNRYSRSSNCCPINKGRYPGVMGVIRRSCGYTGVIRSYGSYKEVMRLHLSYKVIWGLYRGHKVISRLCGYTRVIRSYGSYKRL